LKVYNNSSDEVSQADPTYMVCLTKGFIFKLYYIIFRKLSQLHETHKCRHL